MSNQHPANVVFLTDTATERLQALVEAEEFSTRDDAASYIIVANTGQPTPVFSASTPLGASTSSELYASIAKFYKGDELPTASFIDLVLLVGRITHGLVSGSHIEMTSFDGSVKRARMTSQLSLKDTAECLSLLADLIADRLDRMPEEEVDRLERAAHLLNARNEL